jgi:hypothetical protein
MTLEGRGNVVNADGFDSTVAYRIKSQQEFQQTGSFESGNYSVPTQKSMQLELSECSTVIPVSLTRYTLKMENGKELDFFVQSRDVYVPTGPIR